MANRRPPGPPRGKINLTRRLAWFRYRLRRFLHFSERAAHESGITPLQHQLLLGVAGFTGRGWATVSDLSEFLQERHNAVVGLVQRAEKAGLVRKGREGRDQRFVQVTLSPHGAAILRKLTQLHRRELERFEGGFQALAGIRPANLETKEKD